MFANVDNNEDFSHFSYWRDPLYQKLKKVITRKPVTLAKELALVPSWLLFIIATIVSTSVTGTTLSTKYLKKLFREKQ